MSQAPHEKVAMDVVDSQLADRWDDFLAPATAINPPGAASDPDRDATDGTLLFDAAATEVVFIAAQMPHKWKEGSEIHPHVHWSKTTSAAGDVVWRCEHKIIPIGATAPGTFTALTDAPAPVTATPDGDTAGEHLITAFEAIAMTGKTLSCMVLFKLSRIGGDAEDTYAADAKLLEFDFHYVIDSRGSLEEYTK